VLAGFSAEPDIIDLAVERGNEGARFVPGRRTFPHRPKPDAEYEQEPQCPVQTIHLHAP
jgi:hypothetical protein